MWPLCTLNQHWPAIPRLILGMESSAIPEHLPLTPERALLKQVKMNTSKQMGTRLGWIFRSINNSNTLCHQLNPHLTASKSPRTLRILLFSNLKTLLGSITGGLIPHIALLTWHPTLASNPMSPSLGASFDFEQHLCSETTRKLMVAPPVHRRQLEQRGEELECSW